MSVVVIVGRPVAWVTGSSANFSLEVSEHGVPIGVPGSRITTTTLTIVGYVVFATGRRPEALEALSSIPNVYVLKMDVCDVSSIQHARDQVSKFTGGKLDVLINAA